MTSILPINHHINNVNNFISDVKSSNQTHYVFAARHYPWVNANGVNDDTAIQVVNTSVAQAELDIYNEMLFGKLVQASDVTHVIPR